jgi:hypothetical protein
MSRQQGEEGHRQAQQRGTEQQRLHPGYIQGGEQVLLLATAKSSKTDHRAL